MCPMRRFALAFSGIVLTVLVSVQPQQATATTVTATICTVNTFPCPLINTVDSGIRTNGVGILGANRYSLLPFVFADAFATFTGNILVTDSAGVFIYMWGGGVATNLAAPAGGFYLDVGIQQTYLTAAGVGQFSEFNNGNCNAATIGTTSGVAATLGVNGGFLPVLGAGFNNCPAFSQGAGPAAVAIGNFTTLTAL